MTFRYYSTQHPLTRGKYPEKPGCDVNKYPEAFYISNIANSAWGHIDYEDPLMPEEVEGYGLTPERIEFNVSYKLDYEQALRLHKLLPAWREYTDDGRKPFEHYDMEDLFKVIMQTGSYHDVNKKIWSEEYRIKLTREQEGAGGTGVTA